MKIWFQNHRYKTKKAQKDREKIDQKPTSLQLHSNSNGHHQTGNSGNGNKMSVGSSPKRIAIPVLVKDGKPCGGSSSTMTSGPTSGSAGLQQHGGTSTAGAIRRSGVGGGSGNENRGESAASPSAHQSTSPASSAASSPGSADVNCCDYRPSLPDAISGMHTPVGNVQSQQHQRSSCVGGPGFSMMMPSPKMATSGNSAAYISGWSTPPPLHVGARSSMPIAVGNGGMPNGGSGSYLSSSFGPPPPPAMSAAAAMMMTSSRHMPPPPTMPGLSLHDSMNYADFASSRSCFFNGRTW